MMSLIVCPAAGSIGRLLFGEKCFVIEWPFNAASSAESMIFNASSSLLLTLSASCSGANTGTRNIDNTSDVAVALHNRIDDVKRSTPMHLRAPVMNDVGEIQQIHAPRQLIVFL